MILQRRSDSHLALSKPSMLSAGMSHRSVELSSAVTLSSLPKLAVRY